MAKNIVICSDGTGNTTVKGRGTNVFKLFESVDLNGHRFDPKLDPQVSIYDDGVGTEDFKPLKIFAGMTGWGLGRNIRQLYKELCRIYDTGDRIFLFGFSRGAFTVRTLAGLILRCGIIDAKTQITARAFEATVKAAYKAYRSCYRTALMRLFLGDPKTDATADFKAKFCNNEQPKIHFIGVWDTVDAVGMPFRRGAAHTFGRLARRQAVEPGLRTFGSTVLQVVIVLGGDGECANVETGVSEDLCARAHVGPRCPDGIELLHEEQAVRLTQRSPRRGIHRSRARWVPRGRWRPS